MERGKFTTSKAIEIEMISGVVIDAPLRLPVTNKTAVTYKVISIKVPGQPGGPTPEKFSLVW